MIPATLENAVYGLVSTPALYLADKHGIFRFLIDEGPADSATLADRLGVDRDTAQQLQELVSLPRLTTNQVGLVAPK